MKNRKNVLLNKSLVAISLLATVSYCDFVLAKDKDSSLDAEVIMIYSSKDTELHEEGNSIKKIDTILKNNFGATHGVDDEENYDLKRYYSMVARLMSSGNVITSKYLMDDVSKLDAFKKSKTGVFLKRFTDGSIEYSEDELSESEDKTLVSAYKIINKFVNPYISLYAENTAEYQYSKQTILGCAYGDKIAVNSAIAMLYSMGEKNLSLKLKNECIQISNEILNLKKDGKNKEHAH